MNNRKRTGNLKSRNLFFAFSFIPYLQFIPFFVMNGRLPKRHWILMGFAYILLIVIGILLPVMGNAWYSSHYSAPSVYDYFPDRDSYSYSEASEMPEYKEYQIAAGEYSRSDEYQRLYRIRQGSRYVGRIANILTMVMAFILSFLVERYVFLSELQDRENRERIYSGLENRSAVQEYKTENRAGIAGEHGDSEREKPVPEPDSPDTGTDAGELTDVNTAGEEELLRLPGMNVIDAKRIIAAREKNGPFASADDFYASFHARPHVMVNMQGRITVRAQERKTDSGSAQANRFDI